MDLKFASKGQQCVSSVIQCTWGGLWVISSMS